MQNDPNPMPWGALDRYQAHFIVRAPDTDADIFVRTNLVTSGHFAAKKIVSVRWEGTDHVLLHNLNEDNELNEMIAKQSVKDASICVEQTVDHFRIHGKWNDSATFVITRSLFEIYDRIAGHIKSTCVTSTA